MWDLIPGDLVILVHNGLYRYVSRGTGYRGRWWLGVMITTMLGVIQVGIGWLMLVVGFSDALIWWGKVAVMAILLVLMVGLGWVLYHWGRLLRRLVRQQDAPIQSHRHETNNV